MIGSGLRLAIGTLSIVPVGDIHPLPRGAGKVAMIAAPFAVLPIAAVAGVVFWLSLVIGVPAVVSAVLFLATLAVLTRAMHLDGLADTIDGLGGGWTRDRALEIMRRGDVGPMGVSGLILVLVAQVGSLTSLAVLPWAGLLAGAAVCASRFAATLLCAKGVPAARDSGLGAVVAGSVPPVAAGLVATVVGAALCGASMVSGMHWWWGLVATGAMVLALAGLLAKATRRLGGITGDVIGAGIEIAFTVAMVALAVGAGR